MAHTVGNAVVQTKMVVCGDNEGGSMSRSVFVLRF